jgi:hypothetical protein
MIKPRRMRWAGHVERIGRGEVYTGFWWGNLRKRDHLKDPYIVGRIISKLTFKKWDGSMDWTDVA